MKQKYRIITNNTICEATPELLAEMFAEMDSTEQAKFFNRVSEVASKWESSLCMQLQYITDDDGLTLRWTPGHVRDRRVFPLGISTENPYRSQLNIKARI